MSPPVVWTGREVIVARAGCCAEIPAVALAAYDPGAGTWRQLPTAPLTPRTYEAGAWTGTELVVAGGLASPSGVAGPDARAAVDGAAWKASSDSWQPIAPMPLPIGTNTWPTAVWTGHEVLVWSSSPSNLETPGREVVEAYDPARNQWRVLPGSGLTPRADSVVVWTGTELVVWGGRSWDYTTTYADGARLDPSTGTWRSLPPAPVPGRSGATASWSGHEMLLWGGSNGPNSQIGKGAAYDPTANRWRALALSPLRAKVDPASAWTGRYFVVVGGAAGSEMPVPGPTAAAYDPGSDRWTTLPSAPEYPPITDWPTIPGQPSMSAAQRADGDALWTGRQLIVVGGLDYRQQAPRPDGIVWTPGT